MSEHARAWARGRRMIRDASWSIDVIELREELASRATPTARDIYEATLAAARLAAGATPEERGQAAGLLESFEAELAGQGGARVRVRMPIAGQR